jgi:hypothetical protein
MVFYDNDNRQSEQQLPAGKGFPPLHNCFSSVRGRRINFLFTPNAIKIVIIEEDFKTIDIKGKPESIYSALRSKRKLFFYFVEL